MLIQENQELGRQLSQGRIAQLEAELALQKKYSEELKSSQDGKGYIVEYIKLCYLYVYILFYFVPTIFVLQVLLKLTLRLGSRCYDLIFDPTFSAIYVVQRGCNVDATWIWFLFL